MFPQCNTSSIAQWFYTLRYYIKGSVATLRAMLTLLFLSWLPEALRGLMTKQLSCMHNSVVLLLFHFELLL